MTRSGRRLGLPLALAILLPLCLAPATHAASFFYRTRNLVADLPGVAEHTDPDLVNPWGVAFNPFGFVWVADGGTGKSTLYDGNGVKQSLVVTIPGGKPTGITWSGSPSDFPVTPGNPARFIWATENGVIAAWNPTANPTNAIAKASKPTAIYKGVAIGANGSAARLFATDFHNARVDVWDSNFVPVTLPLGAFVDPGIPPGFAPFGIQNLNGDLWITYAKQDEDREDDVAGAGLGFVDVYDTKGGLIRRVVTRLGLNAPWGIALAPADFGFFSNRLLVGNFGDGTISAYDAGTGLFLGRLNKSLGRPLVIEGLWGIAFGSGFQSQPTNTLYFASGPDDEEHGIYGSIKAFP